MDEVAASVQKHCIIRALLCAACNTAFGLLNEDPVRIEALLHYAQAQKAVTVRLDEN